MRINPNRARLDRNEARMALRDEMWTMRMAAMAEGHAKDASPTNALTEHQRQTLEAFITEAAGISESLAADDLVKFNQHKAKLPEVLSSLQQELAAPHPWHDLIQGLPILSPDPAKDLVAARQSFLPFSTAMVELVKRIKKEDSAFSNLKIYHCPMAPKPGLWMQAQGPLRNPFYGAQMLTCGEEVKPQP